MAENTEQKINEILENAIYKVTAVSEALQKPGDSDRDLNFTVSGLQGFGLILDEAGDQLRDLRQGNGIRG